jgi:protein-disulfide isomerase
MRKAEAKTTIAAEKTIESPDKSDHFTIKIPRLRFKDNSLNVYLVFTLIIFAFILGMLTNKVLYLQAQLKSGAGALAANAAPTQAVQPTDVPPPAVVNVENGHFPSQGNKDAKVTVVEFSDFQCPFCKQYIDQTAAQIKSTYIDTGKIQFFYRQFPLTTIHPNALKSANAAECAQEQNRFWDYHDILFKNQDTWSPMSADDASAAFVDYANQLGMNGDQFKSCLDSNKYDKNVKDDMAAGTKVQVDGTPAFFINGNRLTGAQPFSEFQTLIDQELKK